jgi:hypothetical protein
LNTGLKTVFVEQAGAAFLPFLELSSFIRWKSEGGDEILMAENPTFPCSESKVIHALVVIYPVILGIGLPFPPRIDLCI